jgi:predicted DNA-binding WGR domain protein
MQSNYYWINKEKARYYKILIQKDMLNDWILTCVWGGIHSRLGNYSHLKIDNENEAKIHIENIMKRRKSHGYELQRN